MSFGCAPEPTPPPSDGPGVVMSEDALGIPPRFLDDVTWSDVPEGRGALSGDYDGDGHLDLAITQHGRAVFSVARGVGDGTFDSAVVVHEDRLQAALGHVTQADLDGDGRMELVYLSTLTDNNAPRRARITSVTMSEGGFSARINDHDGYAGPVALGDIHGDGLTDVVVAYSGTNDEPRGRSYFQVLAGRGDKSFVATAMSAALEGIEATDVVTCDIDGDGTRELLLSGSSSAGEGVLRVIWPRFEPHRQRSIPLAITPTKMACADLDGNGANDVVLLDGARAAVEISFFAARGAGDVGFNTLLQIADQSYTVGTNIQVADLNDDGAPEIVLAGNDTRSAGPYQLGPVAVVFSSDGSGRFSAPKVLQFQMSDHDFGAEVVCEDLDHDGQVDLGLLTYGPLGSAKFGFLPGPVDGL